MACLWINRYAMLLITGAAGWAALAAGGAYGQASPARFDGVYTGVAGSGVGCASPTYAWTVEIAHGQAAGKVRRANGSEIAFAGSVDAAGRLTGKQTSGFIGAPATVTARIRDGSIDGEASSMQCSYAIHLTR